jgi:RNA polymerase sigma-70 factor (ECF subfamily)
MMSVMAAPLAAQTSSVSSPLREFNLWMTAEQPRVFILCYRLLQDRDEADTATQDVFLKAYQALGKQEFATAEDQAKWLTRVAVNTALDRLRSARWKFWKRRVSGEAEDTILQATPSTGPDAERSAFSSEVERRIAAALARLSDRQRAVFTLRHYEDRSLDEIADLLGLDTGSVKSHLFRAMAKLREELKDLYWGRRQI